MCPRFQFVPSAGRVSRCVRRALFGFLAGTILICPLVARGQDAPFGVIGRVEGRDISCENGTPSRGVATTTGTSLDVANGTVVTVHSGQALMTLLAGGEVGICGPAKFTVLLSGESFTLALNFGRVRVELPAKTDLRIFTPTIIGTPIDISGGARDVTVGLSLDDSLCVLASSGAIQLEHQFTSEKLIVPQGGEFFLNAGRLLPVAGTPGSCHCVAGEPTPVVPVPRVVPDYAVNVAPRTTPVPAPAAAPVAAEPEPETRPTIEVSVLAEANQTHPVVPPAKDVAPAAPPTPGAVYTAVLPPLTFMAGSPIRPPDPTPDMVLLIREAKVSPEWEFTGHVAEPEFAQAMQHALGEKAATAQAQPPAENQPAAKPAKKRGGFWASLKRVFG
jgi:hypothetical protein